MSNYWDLTSHVRGALAEALVAEAVFQLNSDTEIHGPRHPGYDVESPSADLRVDAKVASILTVPLDSGTLINAVEWDAGTKSKLVADSASHLGLAVIDEESTYLRLHEGAASPLEGSVAVGGRVFLVPKDVIIKEARPIWSVRDHRDSKGRFRYLPLRLAEQYEAEMHK